MLVQKIGKSFTFEKADVQRNGIITFISISIINNSFHQFKTDVPTKVLKKYSKGIKIQKNALNKQK